MSVRGTRGNKPPIVRGNIFSQQDEEAGGEYRGEEVDHEDELEEGGDDDEVDSDGGDDSGSETPLGEPSKKRTKQERKIWTWAKGDLAPQEMPPTNINIRPKNLEDCRFPVDIFLKLFGTDNLHLLREQTNVQRASKGWFIPPIRLREIRETLGILMYMSVVRLPSIDLFWKKSMNITTVSRVMSQNRFRQIVSCLHLSNSALQPARGAPDFDKLYKVRDFLANLNQHFAEHAEREEVISVHEHMIPFKGTLGLKKIFGKNLPSKWGIKVKTILYYLFLLFRQKRILNYW